MPTAVVTGASSGIGLELARLLAADHYDLILVARRKEELERLASEIIARHGVNAWCVVADLATAAGCERVAREAEAPGRDVAVLINNAGFGRRGRFADVPVEPQLEMIDLNVRGLTYLTRLLLPKMVQRAAGRILNVASTAAFQPGPLMSVYYATKAFVLSFSVALSIELEGTGVTCTVLCPGPTATEFQRVAGMNGTPQTARGIIMHASTVALAGYRGLMRGKRIVTPGALNRMLALGTRVVPQSWAARVAKASQEARGGPPS
jgi:short-subunit dehydrogenase